MNKRRRKTDLFPTIQVKFCARERYFFEKYPYALALLLFLGMFAFGIFTAGNPELVNRFPVIFEDLHEYFGRKTPSSKFIDSISTLFAGWLTKFSSGFKQVFFYAKKSDHMKKLIVLSLFTALTFTLSAQEKWEGGVFLGISNYMGDMVEPRFTLAQSSPAFGLLLRNHISERFGVRLNLLYGKIKGADENYEELASFRDASFSSSLVEISAMGEYEFLGNKRYSDDGKFNRTVSPYIFAGIGMSFVNPDPDFGATPNALEQLDIDADYSNTHFALPIGIGIRFDLNSKLNLGIEYGQRLSFSDYLDGVKASGDPDNNDIYAFGGLVLGFRFGEKDSDKDGIADEKDQCPTQPGTPALNGCPDADGDGLADREDNCPNEAGDIRLNGCPDRDGDGVADNVDDCPDQSGLRRFSGCPDSDNDGIVDKEDNCPTTPGLPAMNGCPDADRDGITDDKDACPDEPGTSEHGGCPDTDNDGIADKTDKCPDRPGLKKFAGCPDSDNDGLDDSQDKCPLLPGLLTNEGCPEIKAEDKKVLELAMRNVQFETGSSKLLPSSNIVLNQIAEIIKRYPGYKLSIDGYTDNVGNDFANQQLSEARAKTCLDYLVGKGVDKAILSYKGHGENNPIADNSSSEGRRKNRRVEFTLSPQ
jgi:outer membrane protein OmpA-like peptidoglycan-associated protein/opacity protein-like surface antigen